MKQQFLVCYESGLDALGAPVMTRIKTFKNEPDAIAFYENPRNERRYPNMTLESRTGDGSTYEWDARNREWRQP